MAVSYNSRPDNSVDLSSYKIVKVLGKGSFGTTYLTEDNIGHQYALKLIDYDAAIKQGLTGEAIMSEAESLKGLSSNECNPYLICYYGSWDFTYNNKRYITIVSDFVDGMTLRDFLEQPSYRGGYIAPSVLWPLITQLFTGLKYIHEQGYAHRDIKPENIMITPNLDIKYIDFGLACTRKCDGVECVDSCTGKAGTLIYDPPEMLNGTYVEDLKSAQKRDVWSLLLVCYELAGGNYSYPFSVSNARGDWLSQDELIQNIVYQQLQPSTYRLDDGRTSQFLSRNLIRDVERRPTITQLFNAWLIEVVSRPHLAAAPMDINPANYQLRQQLIPLQQARFTY